MFFPISLAEITVIVAAVMVAIIIVTMIMDFRKKLLWKSLGKLATIGLITISIFTTYFVTSEMQYNRKPLPIPLYQNKVEKEEVYDVVEYFLDDYNYCASQLEFKEDGNVIAPYDFETINTKLQNEYKKLDDKKFGGYFNKISVRCKPMMSSAIYSEFGITGVDFGFFGEANVNTVAPMAGLPMTMAHEMAHIKGVMREGDANLTAMYVLLTSDDSFLRFSGYFWGFYRILNLANYTGNKEDYATLSRKIAPEINKNDYYNYKYWKDHDLMQQIGDWINDMYLKSSGTEGTSSYNDTPTEIDEEKEIIVNLSIWQKLYFGIYMDKVNN